MSRASAEQRAGRAGRTRPGRALRLYTRHDFEQRPAYDVPEIARADLAELAMTLAALGVHDAADLDWLEPPPAAAWGAARALLTELGAVDAQGLTAIGRRMQPLPTHPRLARIVVAGQSGGCADDAALAATLIAERDIRRTARASFSAAPGEFERGADIGDLIEAFRDAERERFRPDALRRLELDARAVEETRRARRQLLGSLPPAAPTTASNARRDWRCWRAFRIAWRTGATPTATRSSSPAVAAPRSAARSRARGWSRWTSSTRAGLDAPAPPARRSG